MKTSRYLSPLVVMSLILMMSTTLPHQMSASAETPAATTAATQSADTVVPYLGVLIKEDFPDPRLKTFRKSGNDNWQIVSSEDGSQLACNEATTQYSGLEFGSEEWKNYSVEYRAKVTAWDRKAYNLSGNAYIGLRGKPGTSYIAVISVPDQFASSLRVNPDGSWTDFGGRGITARKDTLFTFRAEIQANRLRAFYNGQLVIDKRDSTLSNGAAAIGVTTQSTLCVGEVVVRSLENSPDALSLALKGRLARAVQVHLSLDKSSALLPSVQKGDEVFILDTNADKKQTLIRIDKTGIQGWIPSDALGLVPTSTKTS